ncbi:MAG: hypothetical protein NVS3B12_28170 [Acidimicrobiales bacterium]
MPKSNTLARSMHDVGLAAWFGGSLMGAIGLNAASGEVGDPKERAKVANVGWNKWTTPNAVAIGTHLTGSLILLKANKGRLAGQKGAGTAALAKTVLTGAALGATAYARVQGQKVMAAGNPPVTDGVTPSSETPHDVAAAQKQLKMLQWVIPASTGALLVLAAAQSEQQRPAQVAAGALKRFVPDAVFGLSDSAQGHFGDLKKKAKKRAAKAQKQAQRRGQAIAKQAGARVPDLAGPTSAVSARAQSLVSQLPDLASQLGTLTDRLPSPVAQKLNA